MGTRRTASVICYIALLLLTTQLATNSIAQNNIPGPIYTPFNPGPQNNTKFRVGIEANNGVYAKDLYQMIQGADKNSLDAIDGVVSVPVTSTDWGATGVSGMVVSKSIGTNAVGLAGYAIAGGDGTATDQPHKVRLWSLNTLCDDRGYNHVVCLNEFDVNVFGPDTQVLGISLGGASDVDPTPDSIAFLANTLGFTHAIKWPTAFATLDGTAKIFGSVGTLNFGNNTDSQTMQFFSRDAGGVVYRSGLYANPEGAFTLFAGPLLTAKLLTWDRFGGLSIIDGGSALNLGTLNAVPFNDTYSQILNWYARDFYGSRKQGSAQLSSAGSLNFTTTGNRGDEVLSNGALTGGTQWIAAPAFLLVGGAATYSHGTGVGSGTLTQLSGDFQIPMDFTTKYELIYTISGLTGSTTCQITSSVAAVPVRLDTLTAGTHSVMFETNGGPGDFVIQCTSIDTASITFDDLSIKQELLGHTLVWTVFGQLVIPNENGGLSIGTFTADPGSDSQPIYQYARSIASVDQSATLRVLSTGDYSLCTGEAAGMQACYAFQADGWLAAPQSFVANGLTGDKPVLTSSSKALISGDIDIGNSNHIDGTGLTPGDILMWGVGKVVPFTPSGDGVLKVTGGVVSVGPIAGDNPSYLTLSIPSGYVLASDGTGISWYTLTGLATNLRSDLKDYFDTIYSTISHTHSVAVGGTTSTDSGHSHTWSDSTTTGTPIP